jgi:polysaccharide pyruvyl transferase WcaK-like protein
MQNNTQPLQEFIKDTDFQDTLFVGYYGGGNFGDELLLEILLNLVHANHPDTHANVFYLHPEWFKDFHQDFGHRVVRATSLKDLAKGFLRSRQIVVGGGGLWGPDFNPKVMALSLMLWAARRIFRKKVYLLGVGYYSSATKMGHLGASFAGWGAHRIFARDKETYDNFSKISKHVTQSVDLSTFLSQVDTSPYNQAVAAIEQAFKVDTKTAYICIRKFDPVRRERLHNIVTEVVANNPDKRIVLGMLEPREIYPEGYTFIHDLAEKHPNASAIDFHFNPVAFDIFTRRHRDNLVIIAPHYHAIAIAIYNHIPYLPIVYANKTVQLLQEHGITEYIKLEDLAASDVQSFLDREF